jgi:aryl-alcohol dehydrogenase-like predicted oxidoreductase
MDYTRLGTSGLKVSRITLGCMSFGDTSRGYNQWALNDEQAEPIFSQAVELGITFWDTANAYGFGTSEEIVGRAIRKYTRREDIVLATKVYFKMGDGPGESGLSRRVLPHDDKPIVDAVQAVAGERGVPMAQVALAWVLKNPVVSAPIVGPTRPGHLADAVAALDIRLTDDETQRLEAPYTPRTPTGFQ